MIGNDFSLPLKPAESLTQIAGEESELYLRSYSHLHATSKSWNNPTNNLRIRCIYHATSPFLFSDEKQQQREFDISPRYLVTAGHGQQPLSLQHAVPRLDGGGGAHGDGPFPGFYFCP